ncbi:IS701 family transposase [Streptosporangium sp. NBC_01639]|uniref:IS701 family transposase n=1 Tax=Streptosporangium sp. NBC_01639 TaxID=2975948 RepID=UPI00386406DE|nr:IS701 family transposase [Streptosporangium sp. NBC_01639]
MFLGYASTRGRALLDRELYLPRLSWIADTDRCAQAGIPDDTGFATKPQLLRAMIERAITAGVPFSWVTADEAYGDNGPLRRFLETGQIGYVLAVARDHQITTGAGKVRADVIAEKIPKAAWQRLSCGPGAKGERRYDWALIATTSPAQRLLIRRSLSTPSALAFYLCHSPAPVSLSRLVSVASARWTIEECFRTGKNEAVLDRYQVRLYPAWYRYMTLAMLALAFLAVTRATLAGEPNPPDHDHMTTGSVGHTIVISANEIRRLFASLTRPSIDEHHIRHWSVWRIRHQTRARRAHYQRQRNIDH